MSTLFSALGLAQQSLQAQQLGLEITQKNIANINTPGYSRQRLNLTPADPVGSGIASASTGVSAASIESFRNRFLDHRVTQELQEQGFNDSMATALRQVEALLNETGGHGLETVISNFFNSFSLLANAPEDITLRQQVLARASELGREIGRLYDQIQSVQTYQDYFVADTVKEINSITTNFAGLNARIIAAENLGSNETPELIDQRQQLLERLSGLMDISYYETETGAISLITKDGAVLVLEDRSHTLEAIRSVSGGLLQVELDGVNITSKINGGKLGGILTVRDKTIPAYLTALDELAATMIERVNDQHELGDDFTGVQGGDFFVPFVQSIPGSNLGAARSVSVAISDPRAIAAAVVGGGPGSNANARLLAGIQDEKLLSAGTATVNQYYAEMIIGVGNDIRAVEDTLSTQNKLLVQLENQRDSFSGVNLDEEAINIVRYQKAFEASARVVRLLDGLSEEIINLLGV
jgi:flagellar hook-associated protein 1 FlgK